MCQLWSASHWCQAWCYLIVRRYANLFFFFLKLFFWSEDLEESWVFFVGSARWNWRIYLRSKCGDQRHPEEMEVKGLSIIVPKGGGGLHVTSVAGTVPLQACRRTKQDQNQDIPSWLKKDCGTGFLMIGTRVNPEDPFFSLFFSKTLSLRHLLLWPQHAV